MYLPEEEEKVVKNLSENSLKERYAKKSQSTKKTIPI